MNQSFSAQQIAGMLGKQIWQSDLFMPQYKTGEIGPWKMLPGGQLIHDWGYYSGYQLVLMAPSLARRPKEADAHEDAWEVWMSLTAHEIESQELGCRFAYGHTVIMGLGMGWIAANTALNPNVQKVTIVELESQLPFECNS